MLTCQQCEQRMDQPHYPRQPGDLTAPGGWAVYQQMRDSYGHPLAISRGEFCSEACLRAFYQRPVEGAPTQRLPALAKVAADE